MAALAACLLIVAVGCASGPVLPQPGEADADKFLFDRGMEEMAGENWLAAREYFRRIIDGYPQSQLRADAKLALGDTYIGEDSIESNILAVNEFREFLRFFPTHARADYAQYRIVLAKSRQMLSSQRDQTATRETLQEVTAFVDRYAASEYRDEVDVLQRQARERLSEHEFGVGRFYFGVRAYLGAIDRFRDLLAADPAYSRIDAVYYHMGEAYFRINRPQEALPYFTKVAEEYANSEYRERSLQRIAEIKP